MACAVVGRSLVGRDRICDPNQFQVRYRTEIDDQIHGILPQRLSVVVRHDRASAFILHALRPQVKIGPSRELGYAVDIDDATMQRMAVTVRHDEPSEFTLMSLQAKVNVRRQRAVG